jgi:hypothetical protein
MGITELSMKFLFSDYNAFRLLYLIVTNEDIETIVDDLPESGMTAKDRKCVIAIFMVELSRAATMQNIP